MPALSIIAAPSAPSPPLAAGSNMPAALRRLLLPERGGAATPGELLRRIVAGGLDRLPPPGHGATAQRWRALAEVAGHDLSLLKLYEGHTDALAILAELGASAAPDTLWGVWCAEPPDGRVVLHRSKDGAARLSGRKLWCSGAATVDHALVSCWDGEGLPWLAAVALDQPGVTVTADGWHAVGMAGSASVDVVFDNAEARLVGASGSYVRRPGFWHGGAGIAACWYGAAQAIADSLHAAVRASAARQAADLPVFLRQSHAERDLASLGRMLSESEESPWAL